MFNIQNKRVATPIALAIIIIVSLVWGGIIGWQSKKIAIETESPGISKRKTRGIVMLIEYQDTVGLVNFVNELHSRGIHSLLSASPDFVEENCEVIRKLTDYGMEIVSQNPSGSFWDMPYNEQYEAIKDAKERIEACTDKPLRVVSSRYFASDENTVKVAEKMGVPYVLARGTTGTEAIVFQPEEYNVRILSVSNIPSIEFKYGSLCDYSYWVREGKPQDMMKELQASFSNKKVTPATHTNIGGLKKQWNDMWLEFFDTADIAWQDLDSFAESDITMPMWRIPQNKNAPYTPTKKPLIPYEEEEDVDNPCRVEDLPEVSTKNINTQENEEKIVMFHNNKGSMCVEALEFLDTIDWPAEQYLDYEQGFYEKLNAFRSKFDKSEGISESFGYYPIIFIKDKAYSGFNQEIKAQIQNDIQD